jgi:putative peptidoglycan lipid II flippase
MRILPRFVNPGGLMQWHSGVNGRPTASVMIGPVYYLRLISPHRMSRKLLQSTVVTGGMTFVSRVTGLLRDMVFANLIGAGTGVAADSFYVAFRIPNFFRRIFGEGAFSQAFVPVLSEYKARSSKRDIRDFVDQVFGVLGMGLFVITLVGVIAAPVLVLALAPGFLAEPSKYDLTVQMVRITFPYLLFISLVAMAAGILNTHGRFAAAAFTPVLLNLSLIVAALWIAPQLEKPVLALAWGVFIAGVTQLLFQVPFLLRIRMLPRPRLRWRPRHAGVSRVLRLMLPAIFGVSVAQINVLINTVLASFLVTGSVSWLYYSDRLMEFPLGVFGIALATVILPSLSRKHAQASTEEFSHLLDWALRWVFVVGVPASIALVILAQPILTTLFYHGAFEERDVVMSGRALTAFSLGLTGFMLIKVLAPGFYARQDTKTPMRIGVVAMGANIVLSLALIYPLAHVGLALAISLAAFVNAGLLFHLLRRQNVYRPRPGWAPFLLRVGLASMLMAVVLFWGASEPQDWLRAPIMERVLRLAFWVGVGFGVYVVGLWLLGLRFRQLLKSVETP